MTAELAWKHLPYTVYFACLLVTLPLVFLHAPYAAIDVPGDYSTFLFVRNWIGLALVCWLFTYPIALLVEDKRDGIGAHSR